MVLAIFGGAIADRLGSPRPFSCIPDSRGLVFSLLGSIELLARAGAKSIAAVVLATILLFYLLWGRPG